MKIFDVTYKFRIGRKKGRRWAKKYKWRVDHHAVVCGAASEIGDKLYEFHGGNRRLRPLEIKIIEQQEVKVLRRPSHEPIRQKKQKE